MKMKTSGNRMVDRQFQLVCNNARIINTALSDLYNDERVDIVAYDTIYSQLALLSENLTALQETIENL